jgi:hypothetical protein
MVHIRIAMSRVLGVVLPFDTRPASLDTWMVSWQTRSSSHCTARQVSLYSFPLFSRIRTLYVHKAEYGMPGLVDVEQQRKRSRCRWVAVHTAP